jgi:hypothetical protein
MSDDVVNDVLATKSTVKPKRLSNVFRPWGKHADSPEAEYYIKHVNFSLKVLRQYLERVVVKGAGAVEMDPATKAQMVDLYAMVLKATV